MKKEYIENLISKLTDLRKKNSQEYENLWYKTAYLIDNDECNNIDSINLDKLESYKIKLQPILNKKLRIAN